MSSIATEAKKADENLYVSFALTIGAIIIAIAIVVYIIKWLKKDVEIKRKPLTPYDEEIRSMETNIHTKIEQLRNLKQLNTTS